MAVEDLAPAAQPSMPVSALKWSPYLSAGKLPEALSGNETPVKEKWRGKGRPKRDLRRKLLKIESQLKEAELSPTLYLPVSLQISQPNKLIQKRRTKQLTEPFKRITERVTWSMKLIK